VWLASLCALVALPALAQAQNKKRPRVKPRLLLEVETPKPDSVVGDPGGMAFLSGRALALFGELQTFDIMFVVDTSESTSTPSGYDVDGNGKVDGAGQPRWLRTMGSLLPPRCAACSTSSTRARRAWASSPSRAITIRSRRTPGPSCRSRPTTRT
jgi:hypothetical protein